MTIASQVDDVFTVTYPLLLPPLKLIAASPGAPLSHDHDIWDQALLLWPPAGHVADFFTMLIQDLDFLSRRLVHSSNKTKLSMGWSGVNVTAGRIRACDCSGLLPHPRHAYSGAWALGGHRGEREQVLHDGNQIPDPSLMPFSPSSLWSALFLSLSFCLFPLAHLSPL